ncbi:sugar porter family MFS transporter [Puniceicoccus vermicola]|uniref:Sugar porter family MFS transporter n=1 Tax=Puniceicoccus vermicola TaxID=388746 RepID=A0A7X1E3E0_9BACT|nr:sugar porter family MFS transporter [Puniceicoccus vermicola]MBC2600888.1 sugar porter family MFS transporter [Puniceicoccus vermicola]
MSEAVLPEPVHKTLSQVEANFANSTLKPLSGFTIGIVAAMSGVLFGFDASIAAACGTSVNTHFGITNSPGLMGLWVGCVPLGALFGAMLGGKVSSTLGRKKGLLLNALLFIAGIVLAAVSPGFWVFVVARLLMGLAIGNSAVITPMYMAEVAPPENRGRILFMYQLSIVIGILVSFIVGVTVDSLIPNDDVNWRVMIGVGLIPAFIFLFGMFRMPNSPRWLIEKGRWAHAHEILLRMMDRSEARKTFSEIHENAVKDEKVSIKSLFSKLFFPVILLGFFLQFFQQSTGINADMYFGPEIFREGGFSQTASMWAQVAMGMVNLIATIVSIFLVDRLGRRKLMMIGVSGIVLMLCVQSYLFHAYDSQRSTLQQTVSNTQTAEATQRPVLPNTGAAVIHKGYTQSKALISPDAKTSITDAASKVAASVSSHPTQTVTYLIFGSILLYIVFFAISAGPLCWCIISEIFPMHLRGIGMSIAVAANWLVDYFVSQLFPVMKQDLGMTVTTLIYAAFTTLGLALAAKFLPETKGVPLEEIERNIYAGKPLREIGVPSGK